VFALCSIIFELFRTTNADGAHERGREGQDGPRTEEMTGKACFKPSELADDYVND